MKDLFKTPAELPEFDTRNHRHIIDDSEEYDAFDTDLPVNNCSKCGGMAHVASGNYYGADKIGYWVECNEFHEHSAHGDKSKCDNIGKFYEDIDGAIQDWNSDNPVIHEPRLDELVSLLQTISHLNQNIKAGKPAARLKSKKVKRILTTAAVVGVLAVGIGVLVKRSKRKY